MQILLLLAAAGLGLSAFLAVVWVFAGWWAKEFDGLDVVDLLDPGRARRERARRLDDLDNEIRRVWDGDSIYG